MTEARGRHSIAEAFMHPYLPLLQARLHPSRLEHSLGVMRVMVELAPICSLDPIQAMTAGLLHDSARDMRQKDQLALAEEAKIEFHNPCDRHPIYLHALVGAYLVAKELGITDRLVLDAIAAHSWAGDGHNSNASLARCLRSADLLAPVREWNGMKKLRSVVCAGRADEAALLECRWLIEYLREQRIPVHPNLARQYQTLAGKLAVDEAFFERW